VRIVLLIITAQFGNLQNNLMARLLKLFSLLSAAAAYKKAVARGWFI
jgi:hypothetical protein